MNLIFLVCILYLKLFIMRVLTLPLAVSKRSKTLSSIRDDVLGKLQRQNRQFNISRPAFLYARHTSKFVKVTPNKINALAKSKQNKYAELILTTRGFSGKSSIQGKHTGKYICMKKNTGQVVLKDTFLEPQCMFYFKRHDRNAYGTFRSAINETWYLGFKKNGDTRHGQRTGLNHTAAWLMIEFQPR